MSTRWATLCLCALALATGLLVAGAPATAEVQHEAVTGGSAGAPPSTAALTLRGQTPWATPASPWFWLTAGVGTTAGAIEDLHVQLTFYNRINDATELGQATNAVPNKSVLLRSTAAVTVSATGSIAATCTTVLPDKAARAPTTVPTGSVPCPAGGPTVILGCTPNNGTCGGVYPVSIALYRAGSTTPVARHTTFLSYQEPGSVGAGGALRVSLIMPLSAPLSPDLSPPSKASLTLQEEVAGVLFSHRAIPLTIAANPVTMQSLLADGRPGRRTRDELESLTVPGGDELIDQPYVPIDVAALAGGGLLGEIPEQLTRGDTLLRQVGLHPTPSAWVDTSSTFTNASATDLGLGLQAANTDHVVLADSNLVPVVPIGSDALTFAQTFSLALGRGTRVTAAAADSQLASFFRADPGDPVLAANQLLATLEFIHFENPFKLDARGIVVEPQGSWQASSPTFLAALLGGMSGNPALQSVTLNQFFSQVPKGGNDETSSRRLQAGTAPREIPAGQATRLVTARARLTSLSGAVSDRPSLLSDLSDQLLATQNQQFDPVQRSAALSVYTQHFDDELDLVSLADLGTITFTSRTAPIPVSVLSKAGYPIKVLVSVDSDKFTFPDGSSRALTLVRPTTAVRIQARSRTSGDRLPVGVTLTTPDGQVVIARTTLTVHSTSISLVGVALTCLAALVLLVWWARTWRRGRRRGPRAA